MNGGDRFFVDTNVLLYSVDGAHAVRQEQARCWLRVLWERQAGRLSWQVLHEFYANAVRKIRVDARPARTVVESFAQWQPLDVSLELIRRGWYWSDRAKVSYWDSLILAAAERLECGWLLSEDFQAGQRFGTVTIVNPFLRSPDEFAFRE